MSKIQTLTRIQFYSIPNFTKMKKKLKSISTLKNQIKKTNLRFRYIKDSGI